MMRQIAMTTLIAGAALLIGCQVNAKKNVDENGDPIVENETYQPTPDSRGGTPRPISSGDRPNY